MSTTTERFRVERLYVWLGLMGLIGLSPLLSGVASVLASSGDIGNWMMIVGGGAMVLIVGWEFSQSDPAEFSKSGYSFAFLAIAALLSLVGSFLMIFSLL